MAQPKLGDVAARAGVSPTTVSRVLNNRGYLSQKTRDKVFAAIRELGYRPNAIARSLQERRSHIIGLIFPTVAHPFYGEMVYRLESRLANAGYRVILCHSASFRVSDNLPTLYSLSDAPRTLCEPVFTVRNIFPHAASFFTERGSGYLGNPACTAERCAG